MAHPALVQAYRLDGVITLFDAVNGMATLDAHVEAVKQAAVADRIVITKTDLLEDRSEIAGLRDRLRALAPGAVIVDAMDPSAGVGALLACGLYDPATRTADVRRWLGEAAQHDQDHHHDDHDHHDHHDHVHHHHGHDERVRTWSLTHDGAVPWAAIETFLDLLLSVHGEKVLRLKGIVELVEDPSRPLVVHAVQRLLHPPARLPAWPDGTRGTRLVLIAIDLPEDYVNRLFSIVTAKPSIDTPDRAALADNPLAIPGFAR